MELTVEGCSNCPMYQYKIDSNWKTISKCNHPLLITNIDLNIKRSYEKEKGIIPLTPENCPLNEENITLIKSKQT
jgi:hypothetical protein